MDIIGSEVSRLPHDALPVQLLRDIIPGATEELLARPLMLHKPGRKPEDENKGRWLSFNHNGYCYSMYFHPTKRHTASVVGIGGDYWSGIFIRAYADPGEWAIAWGKRPPVGVVMRTYWCSEIPDGPWPGEIDGRPRPATTLGRPRVVSEPVRMVSNPPLNFDAYLMWERQLTDWAYCWPRDIWLDLRERVVSDLVSLDAEMREDLLAGLYYSRWWDREALEICHRAGWPESHPIPPMLEGPWAEWQAAGFPRLPGVFRDISTDGFIRDEDVEIYRRTVPLVLLSHEEPEFSDLMRFLECPVPFGYRAVSLLDWFEHLDGMVDRCLFGQLLYGCDRRVFRKVLGLSGPQVMLDLLPEACAHARCEIVEYLVLRAYAPLQFSQAFECACKHRRARSLEILRHGSTFWEPSVADYRPSFVLWNLASALLPIGRGPVVDDATKRLRLHYALTAQDVERFIADGEDVNGLDYDGRTPLHTARSAEVVHALVRAGADRDARDFRLGKTPFDFAICPEVQEALRMYEP